MKETATSMDRAWDTLKQVFKGRGPTFAEVIPPGSILVVPLNEIAMVILNSLRTAPAGSTLLRHSTIIQLARSYPRQMRTTVERRITEAWQYLEQHGFVAETRVMGTFEAWFVTDKGKEITRPQQLSYGTEDLLPDGLLTLALREKAKPLYLAGRFDDACAAAFRQVEVVVRELGAFGEGIVGRQLMAEAFKPTDGPLADAGAPMSEQLAARDLFVGAIGYYRNAFAHKDVGVTDPRQAASIILVANELIALAYIHHAVKRAAQNNATNDADSPQP